MKRVSRFGEFGYLALEEFWNGFGNCFNGVAQTLILDLKSCGNIVSYQDVGYYLRSFL